MTEPVASPPAASPAASSLGRRMGIAALILSVSAFLSRILGSLREVVISARHGASGMTDAYYAAFTLPELMNYFLAGGTLSITFIPLFSAYMSRDDEAGGWRLFSTLITTMGLILLGFTLVGLWATPWVVTRMFSGFDDPAQRALLIQMTRIVMPAQLAFYVGGLLQSTLFVRETFWPAAVAPLVYNVCIIAGGLLLEPWFGIAGFSVGALLGAFIGPLGVPLWAARRQVRYRPRVSLRDPGVRQFLWLSLPLMVGATLVTMDEYLLRIFGASHDPGAVTRLNHARKLMMVLFSLIGQAAGLAALPFLTKLAARGERDTLGEVMTRSMRQLLFIAVVASAGLVVAGDSLVFVVFRFGQFSTQDAQQTGQLLLYFSLGLSAWTVQAFAVRGFYAHQDTWRPMAFGTVVLVLALPLYAYLGQVMGVTGLALASAAGITLNALATLVIYQRIYGALRLGALALSACRGAVMASACAGAAWLGRWGVVSWRGEPSAWLDHALLLVVMGLGFCLTGALLTTLWRPPEAAPVVDRVVRKLRRKRA